MSRNQSDRSAINTHQAGGVAAASVLSALSNFVFMYISAHALNNDLNNEFLAFWSLLTGLFGVLTGVQNETTRGVGAVQAGRTARTRVIAPAVVVSGAIAVVIGCLTPIMATRVLPDSWHLAMPLLAVMALLQGVYATMLGSLGGHAWWRQFATALSGEVVLRVGFVLLVLAVGVSLGGFELATAGAVIIVAIMVAFSGKARTALNARTDTDFKGSLRNLGFALLSTSCFAILVTGYTAILKASSLTAAPALVGGLMMAVSLTRAPIMMPLNAFTGVAIKSFLARKDAPLQALAKPCAALLGLGLIGGAAAYFVGPWFLPFFKPEYAVVSGAVFAALTLVSALMAILTIAGTMVLAMDMHIGYAAGWLVASVVSIGILFTGMGLVKRCLLSLSLGPLAGCLVFVICLLGSARRSETK